LEQLAIRLDEKKVTMEQNELKMERLLHAKDDTIQLLKDQVLSTKTDSFRAQGLLTSRGILEFKLQLVHDERKRLDPKESKTKFNASRTCEYLMELMTNPSSISGDMSLSHTQDMIKYIQECKILNLKELYGILSSYIHSYSWGGMKVKILRQGLAEDHLCILTSVVQSLNLEYVMVNEDGVLADE
jgi:hypothetical protein